MFIDIHTHAYRIKPPFLCNFCTPDELIARYDEEGIERGCVLPIVSPEVYFPQANEDILEMAAQYPDRIIPWCNIDPRLLTNAPNAPLGKVLAHYKEAGCKGLGEVMINLPMMHPLVQNLFRHAEDVGLPVIFDGSDQVGGDFGLYDDPGLPQLEHTLQSFPKLVILGHGPTFWSEIARLETPGDAPSSSARAATRSASSPAARSARRAWCPSSCAATRTSTATSRTPRRTTPWRAIPTTGRSS